MAPPTMSTSPATASFHGNCRGVSASRFGGNGAISSRGGSYRGRFGGVARFTGVVFSFSADVDGDSGIEGVEGGANEIGDEPCN